jgi:carboxypeptidase family protein
MTVQLNSRLIVFLLGVLSWASFCSGQTAAQSPTGDPQLGAQLGAQLRLPQSAEQHNVTPSGEALPDQQISGSISGTVVDQSGAVVTGAHVKLMGGDQSAAQEAVTGTDGTFSFAKVAPGAFQLTIVAAGFATQTTSGTLHAGESYVAPLAALAVATAMTDVEVGVSQIEVAEEQIKVEEQQRVLGVLPNFYVSYIPDAAPLTSKQKFKLAFRTVIDPFTFVFVGGAAGVQQWQNHFEGYGQGAQGYAKRFGAGYGDTLSGTFIGGAILPSILKQDPRYFYKGTGSAPSRFLYAIANAFICKGDNRRWQVNYSNMLGSVAAGGISNLYYPPQDRDGAALTFENAALGIASTAVSNLFQEFVIKKLTPKVPGNGLAKP